MRKRDRGVIVEGWNAHNASPKKLRRYVKGCVRRGAMAIVLTEVWSRHDALHQIAREFDLTIIAERPGPRSGVVVSEHGDTVMLLASGFEVEHDEWIVLTKEWFVFGPPKRKHAPRRLPRVVGTFDGQKFDILGTHGPTGGNHEAVAEFKRALDKHLTSAPDDTVAIAAGDMNFRVPEARAWARARNMRADGYGPDLVLANRRTRSKRGKTKRGSDHYPLTHEIRSHG